MKENKKAKNQTVEKDYYVPVSICQIVLCVVLSVVLAIFVSASDDTKNSVRELLTSEMEYEEVSAAVSKYVDSAESWAVFGDRVSYSEAQDETQAMGGVDFKTYEADKNTSFSPYTVTAEITEPVQNGRYTSLFGYRTNPITGEFTFHTGVDIAAPSGTPIRAAYNGTVSKVGEDSRAGKYIFLEHDDGFVTFYCHCSEITARMGDVIRGGEMIARIGSTGWSTGPHLHFEIRKDNIRLNPMWALENDC